MRKRVNNARTWRNGLRNKGYLLYACCLHAIHYDYVNPASHGVLLWKPLFVEKDVAINFLRWKCRKWSLGIIRFVLLVAVIVWMMNVVPVIDYLFCSFKSWIKSRRRNITRVIRAFQCANYICPVVNIYFEIQKYLNIKILTESYGICQITLGKVLI